MEGMRGAAVFMVFLVHYCTLVNPWIQKQSFTAAVAEGLHTIGNAGVDLFFVLSGYLIYGSLINRRQLFFSFIRRRIRRIYPTFLVVFGLYVALSFALPAENKIPHAPLAGIVYLLENLLLLPGLLAIDPLITVAWSLSYEMFYYVTIPFLIAGFHLHTFSAEQRLKGFALVALGAFLSAFFFGGPIRLAMFLAGILLYEALKVPSIKATRDGMTLGLVIGGLFFMLAPVYGSAGIAVKTALLFIAFFALCHNCFVHPTSRIAAALQWTPLRWLGNMSYSYYLIHGLTLKAIFKFLSVLYPPGSNNQYLFLPFIVVAFAATLIPSTVLFLTIERRFSLKTEKATLPVPEVQLSHSLGSSTR